MNLMQTMLCFVDKEVGISQFPSSVYDGDTLYITCVVDYSGLLAPGFVWDPSPDYVLPVVNTSSSVNSTVGVTVTSPVVQPCFAASALMDQFLPTRPTRRPSKLTHQVSRTIITV